MADHLFGVAAAEPRTHDEGQMDPCGDQEGDKAQGLREKSELVDRLMGKAQGRHLVILLLHVVFG